MKMRKHFTGAATAILTFILGIALGSFRIDLSRASEPSTKPLVEVPVSTHSVSETSESSEVSCLNLIEDNNFHSKLNGWKLSSEEPLSDYEIDAAKLIPLTSGRVLAGAGRTLVMLNSQKRVVWKYEVSQWLIDFDVVESTGLIYGTAGDNIMFILDISSGNELKAISRNGSAAYGQVKAYGRDACLITDNFWGYRDKVRDLDLEPMKDGIAAWRGTRLLWHIDFPPDAELIVNGKRIFGLTKTKTSVYVKEIFPPKV
jgi:hypothetical protein